MYSMQRYLTSYHLEFNFQFLCSADFLEILKGSCMNTVRTLVPFCAAIQKYNLIPNQCIGIYLVLNT